MRGLIFALTASCFAANARASTPAIAVAYFDNNTGDGTFDPLGRGLADMLITDLSSVSGIAVVERRRLNAVLKELDLGKSSFVDPKTAAKLGKGLGAKYIVTGSFASIDPSMRIDGRIVEVATGKVVHATSATGAKSEFFLLEKELAHGLITGIGVKISARDNARLGRVATESFDAFLAWSNGLAALDRGEIEAAKQALETALATDSGFASAKAMLDAISKDVRSLGQRRERILASEVGKLIARLDALAKTKGPHEEVAQIIDFAGLGAMLPAGAHDLVEVTTRVLALELDESVTMGFGGLRTESINAWAMFMFVQAAFHLKRRTEVISYGRTFLKRYPTSVYFQGTQSVLETTLDEVTKHEAGKAERPKIRAKADRYRQDLLCGRHRRPADKIAACLEFVRSSKDEDDHERTSAFGDLMRTVSDIHEPKMFDTLRKVLADAGADAELMERVAHYEKASARRVQDATDARSKIDAVICRGAPTSTERLRACASLVDHAVTVDRGIDRALADYRSQARAANDAPALRRVAEIARTRGQPAMADKADKDLRDLDKAKALATALSKTEDESAKGAVKSARVLADGGAQDEAKRRLLAAVARWPKAYEPYLALVDLAQGEAEPQEILQRSRKAGLPERDVDRVQRRIESALRKIPRYEQSLARRYRSSANELKQAGRYEDASRLLAEGIERFPQARDLHDAALTVACDLFDVRGAAAAVQRWETLSPETVKARDKKRAATLADQIITVDTIEPLVIARYARDLSAASQWRAAADAWMDLAERYPRSKTYDASIALYSAATEFQRAGALAEARKAYERLLEDHPEASQADAARTMMRFLPR